MGDWSLSDIILLREVVISINKETFAYEYSSGNNCLVARYIRVVKYLLLSFSSVGLAKAALEAINGFNLFGNQVKKTAIATTDFDYFSIAYLINLVIH